MEIILLYGSGEVDKQNEALRVKSQFPVEAITQVDYKNPPYKLESLLTSPLFSSGKRIFVVDNVPGDFDLSQVALQDNDLLLLIATTLKNNALLLQSAKKLGAEIHLFDGGKEVTAFPFLDSLIEQRVQALSELKKLLSEYGGMYILTMIYYLLRRNILPLPPSFFMQKKIKAQKQKFKLKDWEELYQLVLQTEVKIKSGVISDELGLFYLVEKIISRKYGG